MATLIAAAGPLAAQAPSPSATYRVFLKNGDALPSFGEAAVVADRIIFNLSIGGSDGPLTLQLISLPLPLIDMERTSRYADAMRAAFYAATRGEAEYSEMTAALSRDLEQLAKIQDRKQQLAVADQLRLGLVAWPRSHFFYRANDIEKLVGLVGDVINELKVAVGEKTFALELTAGPPTPRREPLMVAPRLRESITLSLSASSVADIGEERLAILKSAASITPAEDRELAGTVARRLELEMSAERSYAALAADIRKRAQAAEAAGNATAIDRLETELLGRDQQFGFRRPKTVQDLIEELRVARTSALARQGGAGQVRRRATPAGRLRSRRSPGPLGARRPAAASAVLPRVSSGLVRTNRGGRRAVRAVARPARKGHASTRSQRHSRHAHQRPSHGCRGDGAPA